MLYTVFKDVEASLESEDSQQTKTIILETVPWHTLLRDEKKEAAPQAQLLLSFMYAGERYEITSI